MSATQDHKKPEPPKSRIIFDSFFTKGGGGMFNMNSAKLLEPTTQENVYIGLEMANERENKPKIRLTDYAGRTMPPIPDDNGYVNPNFLPPDSPLDKQVGGDHYKKLKIQPVEYNHANGLDFFQGSVVKYVTRFRDKNGKADLEKAKHFIEMLIELEYPTPTT